MRNDLPRSSASCSQDVILNRCKPITSGGEQIRKRQMSKRTPAIKCVGLHKVRDSCERCFEHMCNVTT